MKEQTTKGIVYILRNEAFKEGIVKIGITNRKLEERIKELSNLTAVPKPYEAIFACEVDNYEDVEQGIHSIIEKHNINKEFFEIDPKKVINILSNMKGFKIITDRMSEMMEKNAVTETGSCVNVNSKKQIPPGYFTVNDMKANHKIKPLFGFRLAVAHTKTKTSYYKLNEVCYFKKELFNEQIEKEDKKQPELKL